MTQDREALVITAGLAALSAVLCASALRLHATAAAVPLAIAVPTLLLLVVQLATDVRHARAPEPRGATTVRLTGGLPRREVSIVGWMILLFALMWAFGILVALPSYLLLYLRWRSGERWSTSLVAAGATWWLLYVVLDLLLRMELRPGVIWIWLVRS